MLIPKGDKIFFLACHGIVDAKSHKPILLKEGILEKWNLGILGSAERGFSTIPSFQYSIVPFV
jgi:hypothetical protein